VVVPLAGDTDADALTDLFDQAGYAAEDWTAYTRLICQQCSEGRPAEDNEHPEAPFAAERRFGLAAPWNRPHCSWVNGWPSNRALASTAIQSSSDNRGHHALGIRVRVSPGRVADAFGDPPRPVGLRNSSQ
jgi:hypothetical protein